MDHSGSITMSMRELGRIKIIQSVIDGLLMPGRAAEQLELSVRQVERLCLRYRREGPAGLISRKRAHPSNHQLAPGVAARALALIAKRYPDFGPTFACEKIREAHGFDLSVATVRRLMSAAGFWVPRKLRPPKVHQPRIVAHVWANWSKLMAAIIAGLKSAAHPAHCSFLSITRPVG